MDKPWKRFERQVAKVHGTERYLQKGLSAPDVVTEHFIIECKYRNKVPDYLHSAIEQASKYDRNKVPILAIRDARKKGYLYILKSQDMHKILKAAGMLRTNEEIKHEE